MAAVGAELEDKRYSLTVHFRGVPHPVETGRAVLTLLSNLTPHPHLVPGKYSINALPSERMGKGPATLALMTHLGLSGIFYIGDEETDETVFGLPIGIAMAVRVGKLDGSHANYYLRHQEEVGEVLRYLVHRLDRTPQFNMKTGM
jgi:trehalose 6-phosphate phosphatase